MARLLATALRSARVEGVKFTAGEQVAARLRAAGGGQRRPPEDVPRRRLAEHREFWLQAERARAAYRANRTMNFFVDPSEGHDDYLVSAALLVHASRDQHAPRRHGPRARVT